MDVSLQAGSENARGNASDRSAWLHVNSLEAFASSLTQG